MSYMFDAPSTQMHQLKFPSVSYNLTCLHFQNLHHHPNMSTSTLSTTELSLSQFEPNKFYSEPLIFKLSAMGSSDSTHGLFHAMAFNSGTMCVIY